METPFQVVFLQTDYTSLEEAPRETIAEHVARSRQWHADGRLVMKRAHDGDSSLADILGQA